MRSAVLLPVLLVLTSADDAHAWDAAGHRAVCAKAWREMSEPAQATAGALLHVASADAFAETCTWADDIIPQRPETKAWHMLHVPKDARSIDVARDCPNHASCLLEQIEHHMTVVVSGAPKAARAAALKFLAHLVGDLHQPLHVAFAEDRGGEDIKITFLGRETNMHALWDSALLAAPNPPSHGYTPFLQEMTDRYNRERWTAGTLHEWALDTLWIMRAPPTGYVGNPGGLAFDEIYVKQNYLIAADQIDKAGVRLGATLNQAFK